MGFWGKLGSSLLVSSLLFTALPGQVFLSGGPISLVQKAYGEELNLSTETVAALKATMADSSLTDLQKAQKIEELIETFINASKEEYYISNPDEYARDTKLISSELVNILRNFPNKNQELGILANSLLNLMEKAPYNISSVEIDETVAFYKSYIEELKVVKNKCGNIVDAKRIENIALEFLKYVEYCFTGLYVPNSMVVTLSDLTKKKIKENYLPMYTVINSSGLVSKPVPKKDFEFSYWDHYSDQQDNPQFTVTAEAAAYLKQSGVEKVGVDFHILLDMTFPISAFDGKTTIRCKLDPAALDSGYTSIEAPVLKFAFLKNDQIVTKLPAPATFKFWLPGIQGVKDPSKINMFTYTNNKWQTGTSTLKVDEYGYGTLYFPVAGSGTFSAFLNIPSFADIKGHWASQYIQFMAARGIVKGVDATHFEPQRNITRAEFASLVIHTMGLQNEKATNPFADVKSTDWFANVVSIAAKYNIVSGVTKTEFAPKKPISRQEMATMIARAMKVKKDVQLTKSADEILAPFKDKNTVASWAREPMALAIQERLINGVTSDTLSPTSETTRAQAATLMYRFYIFLNN